MTRLYDWTPAAVVFDCDGLLVDTEPCWSVAETALFARRGLAFGPEQKAAVIGKSLAAAGDTLAGLFDEPGAGAEIAAELLVLVAEVVAEEAEAMPGAVALVDLVAASVPFAVASNSPRSLLEAALARSGFAGVFPVSVAADEVSAPKPHPEMYLAACAALGVEPGAALAFEDSATGLRSARAAGLRVVGVPTLAHQDFPADVVVESLRDNDLLAWVSGWRRAGA
ncbi:HAD family hydrolase [Umezawaea tangerina]|uniref:HAD superfamily hydrolase (TIGR01509 family) n=1 Tax=Umezawaea tangerina TaxID=84725 RepID=A0A2T0SWM1_9PSEU|nr:HAD family phosphatase [Umezawaea tangerina]PRY37812.1 HAD superfamily hydrolase (TIGR01509 family) [Umezawaea tangerina]